MLVSKGRIGIDNMSVMSALIVILLSTQGEMIMREVMQRGSISIGG